MVPTWFNRLGASAALALIIGNIYSLTSASAVSGRPDDVPWPVPTDPQERREYLLAHGLRVPNSAPSEAWDAMHERVRPGEAPAARPFNFWLARLKALWPNNPSLAEQYYEHLCEAEAGEYIWRKVKGVDGIVQMRPRAPLPHASPANWGRLEDPYGYNWGESVSPAVLYLDIARFRYFETRLAPDLAVDSSVRAQLLSQMKGRSAYYRYTSAGREGKGLRIDGVAAPKAEYGFVWRGIHRPLDRELGIAGGEFLIVDRRDNSVLAMQRGFILRPSGNGSAGTVRMCPRAKPDYSNGRNGNGQLGHFFSDFVRYVLHE